MSALPISQAAVAVIGLDPAGVALAEAVGLHPDLRLTAVADPQRERGEAAARALGVAFAPDYVEVLDDPTLGGLIVAGEAADRATILAAAAARGRVALTLPPPAATLARLDDLVLAAAEGGARIACPNPWRAVPAMAEATRLVREGALGDPLAVFASHRTQTAAGDPLLELGLPLLDYLIETMATPVVGVQATAATLFSADDDGPAAPDTWLLILRCGSGLVMTVELGRFLPAPVPSPDEVRVEFAGTAGVVVAEPTNLALTIHAADGGTRRDACGPDLYRQLLDDFIPILRDGAEPEQSLVAWRPVISLIEAARRSAADDAPVTVGLGQ